MIILIFGILIVNAVFDVFIIFGTEILIKFYFSLHEINLFLTHSFSFEYIMIL